MHLQHKSHQPLEGCVPFFRSEEVMLGSRPPPVAAATGSMTCSLGLQATCALQHIALLRNLELSVQTCTVIDSKQFFLEPGPNFYVHIFKTFYLVVERYFDSSRQTEVAHCRSPSPYTCWDGQGLPKTIYGSQRRGALLCPQTCRVL